MWRLSSAVLKQTLLGVSLTAWRTGKVNGYFLLRCLGHVTLERSLE